MNIYRLFLTRVLLVSILVLMAGCATLGAPEMSCGFGFDTRYDDQHAVVLDYQLYGEKKWIIGASTKWVEEGHKIYGDGIGYQYDRPRSLYVKWQDELTGNIYQDTVDLRQSLPRNLAGTKLYFLVHGPQLYVYLVDLNKRVNNPPQIGSVGYAVYLNIQLYPTSNK